MLTLFQNRLFSQEINRQVLLQAFEKTGRISHVFIFCYTFDVNKYGSNWCKYLVYIQCNGCVYFDYFDAIFVIRHMMSSTSERFCCLGLGCDRLVSEILFVVN